MRRVSITENVAVGSPPTDEEDVRELARENFQSLLNLRPPEEPAEFSSKDEGVCARQVGLMYLNYPLSEDDVDDSRIDAFRTKLKLLPKPVFIHAESWEWAATLGLIDHALAEDLSGAQALDRAADFELDSNDSSLRDLVTNYVDARRD